MAWDDSSCDALSRVVKHMGCFVWGGRIDIGHFVQGGKSVWDVLSMMEGLDGGGVWYSLFI